MKPRTRIGSRVGSLILVAFAAGALLRAGAGAPAETATHLVTIADMKFSPEELRIRSGDRVIFQNQDLFPHTATARDSHAFDSGLIKAGESWATRLAGAPGTIRYVCLYHPTMAGRIIVERP